VTCKELQEHAITNFAELHTALGQFLSYHTALTILASDRVL
jgi:hypothetical protein